MFFTLLLLDFKRDVADQARHHPQLIRQIEDDPHLLGLGFSVSEIFFPVSSRIRISVSDLSPSISQGFSSLTSNANCLINLPYDDDDRHFLAWDAVDPLLKISKVWSTDVSLSVFNARFAPVKDVSVMPNLQGPVILTG